MKSLVGNGLDGTNEIFIPVAPKGARAPEGVHLLFHKVLASMGLRANVEGQRLLTDLWDFDPPQIMQLLS